MESHGTQVSNPPSQRGFRSGSSQRHARETTAEETVDEDVKYLNNIRNQLFQVSQENGKTPYRISSINTFTTFIASIQ